MHPLKQAGGFTLIELMIGMTIGLVVLLGLTVFFSYNTRNQNDLERSIVRLENSRFALDSLTEDLMHAGYYARHVPGNTATYNSIVLCPTNTAGLGWNSTATQMPPAVSAVNALPSNTAQSCLTGLRVGTSIITVTHAETGDSIQPANTVASNLYIQTTGCTSDTDKVIINNGPASNFTLKNMACNAVNNVHRLSQRTYFISNCNNCTNNDGIPSLKRLERIGNAYDVDTVAEGVEQLQFEFGVDTNNDGQADENHNIAGITGVAPIEWRNVVSVRIHMLTRSSLPDPGYVEERTYLMGTVTLTPADLPAGFKRTLLTTTVPLSNIAGRRE
jgi:type IV pilus assembly protein PilW